MRRLLPLLRLLNSDSTTVPDAEGQVCMALAFRWAEKMLNSRTAFINIIKTTIMPTAIRGVRRLLSMRFFLVFSDFPGNQR